MKAPIAMFLSLMLILPAAGMAEDDGNYDEADMVNVRPGLESEQVSPGVRIVKPEGAEKRVINNNLSVMESAEEYSARKFVDANKRIDELQKAHDELKKEVYFMKKALNNMSKKIEAKRK